MPIDSDPIMSSGNAPDDMTSVIVDAFSSIQYKLVGLVFVLFIFLSSDTFIERLLSKFEGAVDYKYPTSYGTIIQGLLLCLGLIIFDALIKQKII
jgi:hypothetical protein